MGQALQDQIAQVLQPAMTELREQITASVRRELDQKLPQEGRRGRSEVEHAMEQKPERRQPSPRQSSTRPDDRDDEQERPDVAYAGARTAEQSREAAPRDSSSTFDDSDQGVSNEMAEPSSFDSSELARTLQEQISQALQPTMTEFREQMSATVRRELDEALERGGRRPPADGERSTDRGQARAQASSDEVVDQPDDEGRSKGSDPSGQRERLALRSLLGKPLLEALPEVLEQQGEQWLRSRFDLGIDFVFSLWVRAAVQQEVERALQRLARAAIGLVPDRATHDDLQAQSERTVERLTQTAVDKLFADDVREDLKARGHEAIGSLFKLDLKSILEQVQELLLSLFEGLLAVLRECWEQILQLLGKLVVSLLQSRVTAMLKDGLGSLATTPGREGKAKGADSTAAIKDKEADPRRAPTGHADDVPDDDDGEGDRPRQRVKDDEGVADRGGNGSDRRGGRTPSGRPPAGRPATSRQMSGRPSSDRSVSGRSSRATAR